jgi:hypothetical protein
MLITNLSVYRHFAAESATPEGDLQMPTAAIAYGSPFRTALTPRLLFEPMAAWSASRALADDDLRDPV